MVTHGKYVVLAALVVVVAAVNLLGVNCRRRVGSELLLGNDKNDDDSVITTLGSCGRIHPCESLESEDKPGRPYVCAWWKNRIYAFATPHCFWNAECETRVERDKPMLCPRIACKVRTKDPVKAGCFHMSRSSQGVRRRHSHSYTGCKDAPKSRHRNAILYHADGPPESAENVCNGFSCAKDVPSGNTTCFVCNQNSGGMLRYSLDASQQGCVDEQECYCLKMNDGLEWKECHSGTCDGQTRCLGGIPPPYDKNPWG